MKKIGFIDYYLDEWHANNYPEFFKKAVGDEMKVCYAWGETEMPGKMTNAEWAEKNNVELLKCEEEVIEKSDYIVVLAPDNPETHVRLTEKALKSGKLVYVDKTFAATKKEAEMIFENAEKHGTPCYSASALYFSDELGKIDAKGIVRISSIGNGNIRQYAVHQAEQIVTLMGSDVNRVMFLGENVCPSVLLEFKGGRYAQITHYTNVDFKLDIGYDDGTLASVNIESDYFGNFISAMAEFFRTAKIPIEHKHTIAVIGITEGICKAVERPFEWIDI